MSTLKTFLQSTAGLDRARLEEDDSLFDDTFEEPQIVHAAPLPTEPKQKKKKRSKDGKKRARSHTDEEEESRPNKKARTLSSSSPVPLSSEKVSKGDKNKKKNDDDKYDDSLFTEPKPWQKTTEVPTTMQQIMQQQQDKQEGLLLSGSFVDFLAPKNKRPYSSTTKSEQCEQFEKDLEQVENRCIKIKIDEKIESIDLFTTPMNHDQLFTLVSHFLLPSREPEHVDKSIVNPAIYLVDEKSRKELERYCKPLLFEKVSLDSFIYIMRCANIRMDDINVIFLPVLKKQLSIMYYSCYPLGSTEYNEQVEHLMRECARVAVLHRIEQGSQKLYLRAIGQAIVLYTGLREPATLMKILRISLAYLRYVFDWSSHQHAKKRLAKKEFKFPLCTIRLVDIVSQFAGWRALRSKRKEIRSWQLEKTSELTSVYKKNKTGTVTDVVHFTLQREITMCQFILAFVEPIAMYIKKRQSQEKASRATRASIKDTHAQGTASDQDDEEEEHAYDDDDDEQHNEPAADSAHDKQQQQQQHLSARKKSEMDPEEWEQRKSLVSKAKLDKKQVYTILAEKSNQRNESFKQAFMAEFSNNSNEFICPVTNDNFVELLSEYRLVLNKQERKSAIGTTKKSSKKNKAKPAKETRPTAKQQDNDDDDDLFQVPRHLDTQQQQQTREHKSKHAKQRSSSKKNGNSPSTQEEKEEEEAAASSNSDMDTDGDDSKERSIISLDRIAKLVELHRKKERLVDAQTALNVCFDIFVYRMVSQGKQEALFSRLYQFMSVCLDKLFGLKGLQMGRPRNKKWKKCAYNGLFDIETRQRRSFRLRKNWTSFIQEAEQVDEFVSTEYGFDLVP
jgi:hypothetical protein